MTDAAFASTAGQRVAGSSTRATLDGDPPDRLVRGQRPRDLVPARRPRCGRRGRASPPTSHAAPRRPSTSSPGPTRSSCCPRRSRRIVTFLAFYGFNGKSHHEGASFVELGAQQFDPAVTLLADPTDPRAIGLPFDAEGSPRTRYHLVEDGVTRNLAHDRRTAKAVGAETTGDALPGGEGFGAIPGTIVLHAGVDVTRTR